MASFSLSLSPQTSCQARSRSIGAKSSAKDSLLPRVANDSRPGRLIDSKIMVEFWSLFYVTIMLLWLNEPKMDCNPLLSTIESKNLVEIMIVSNSVPADAVLRLHVLVVVLRPAEEPQAHLAGEHGPPVRERGLLGALGGNSIEKVRVLARKMA